jgi:CelD/BcsL family acetyltransferase involved in cellulose biosynthesis
LHVVTGWEGDQLSAILPSFIHEWNGRVQMTLVGSGISDYLDPVVDPPCWPEFLYQLQEHLQSTPGWQVCDWQDLDTNSPLTALRDAVTHTHVPCSSICLTGSFESFWSARPSGLRRNLRRYTQRAQQIAPVTFEVVEGNDPALLDRIIRLHSRRWRAHGEPGMIALNHSAPFLREVTARLSRMVCYFALRFGDDVAAALLAFVHRNEIFAYMSAFDPENESFGFGSKLLYEALRAAHDSRYSAWNFLRGDEPYKFLFGAEQTRRCRITIER